MKKEMSLKLISEFSNLKDFSSILHPTPGDVEKMVISLSSHIKVTNLLSFQSLAKFFRFISLKAISIIAKQL